MKRFLTDAMEKIDDVVGLWDHTAMAPDRKVIVSWVGGKRRKDQTQDLVNDT